MYQVRFSGRSKGVEIDFVYRIQADLFGTELNWQTVFTKTAIDQLLYVPAFGLVLQLLWVMLMVPETKGVPLEKMQKQLGIS